MPKPWRYVSRLGLLALLLVLTACEAEPRRYKFSLGANGGPTGWPVWVEELTFDHSWSSPVGNLGGGFDIRPPTGGKTAILAHPVAAPQSMQARWFSYRTQTFYEIDLELPDTDALLRRWYREYPPSKYEHDLIVGFSGQGEVYVWWQAWCSECSDRSQDFHAPIVESAYGEEAEGDPNWYLEQTQEYIDEGTMPSPW
ncbi:hypothetical protein L861_01795 [Litchfieldella anticariensis FP35 = DSM 16096]|uniref:DUF2931 family protein n=1 Tax=Litchfieldella anticariensis (strain DSM 16096 / CECT 5854 / CIP 108499 / LMG 22089 / FP35) TaxID=1121939 RepID=S2L8A7_LITA3|nr:DUF2931 family protein [Halomonas anticariensis]EPC04064.1 hypothetical protein L861_01795 [Halomonas anticariensis FP35 = DSM 16096]